MPDFSCDVDVIIAFTPYGALQMFTAYVITSTKFRLKQTWRLMKAIAEMKCDTEQTMKLE